MSILQHTQFRYFVGRTPEFESHVIAKAPAAASLFRNTWKDYKGEWADAELFCHEFAHMMDLVRKGKQERINLENFGWPRITQRGWSLAMAKNEAEVFAYQWLVREYFDMPENTYALLGIDAIPVFLEAMCDRKASRDFFHTYCLEAMEKQREGLGDLVNKTVEYVAAAVDSECVAA